MVLLLGLRLSAPDTIAVAGAGASGCFITAVPSCSAPPPSVRAGYEPGPAAGAADCGIIRQNLQDALASLSLSLIFCSPRGFLQTLAGSFYPDLRHFRPIFQSFFNHPSAMGKM